MAIQVIRSARANYSIESYIADKGQLFYDEDTGLLRRSDGITPGGITLSTGADDVQAYLDSVKGNIVPDQDSFRDLGSPEKQWRDLYLSGNSLFLNGVRISVEDDTLILPQNTRIQDQQVSNFSGDYDELTNKPDLSVYQLSVNAFGGDYNDLTNKPDSFSGDYNQLTNKPAIPTNTNQLVNGSGFITLGNLTGYATQAFVTSRGYLTSVDWDDIQSKPDIPLPLSVGLIDSQNNLGNTVSEISMLRFDSDSGFDVTDLGNGAVKIAMNSTFKTWKVDGQDDLIATGLDTIEFEAGQGITITTDPLASPNKKITLSGFSGDYTDLTNTPDLSVYQLSANAFSGDYTDLNDKPDLSVYQISANAFSGDYTDLTNKPTIPTNTNQLTNDAEFITASALSGLATETYVDQAISDVVGAAPEVLDTLKELSDALGNDADFAANITATISAKANSADFNPVAFSGDYTDLTNTPTISSDVSDLTDTNSLLFSGDYTDLTNKPDLSVYQLLADAFNGNYSDLSNKPVVPTDISDLTDEQGRLATAYSFSIAADDSTQRLISNNETVKISGANGVTTSSDNEGNITVSGPNLSTVASSGDYDDLSNKPAIPGDIGDLTDTNNLLFSGDYQDLSNTPTIPQNLNDLSDVDVATNTPQFGQVLKYDGEKWGPAADQGSIDPATGGVVTDASTLNGFAGTYYLNYNNLNNKPAPYELPSATAETLGGVRVGENITVTNGTISVPKGAGINKVVDIPDVYDDNGLENKYILRYNSGATRWETEDLDLSNSMMDGGFY